VVGVSGPLQLGRPVGIQVEGLQPWADAGQAPHKLLLFLDGQPCPGDFPEAVDRESGVLRYHLEITSENREVWEDLLRRPSFSRKLGVSVGPSPDSHFPSTVVGSGAATLQIFVFPWGLISLAIITLALVALLGLARHTNLIRDTGPACHPGRRKPYSLARTQMAMWFYLIFSAYVVIWLVTGDLNSITQSLLGLMGISAATALGGAVIDNQKRDAATAELAKLSRTPSPSVSPPGGDATIPLPSRSDTVRQLEERLDPGVSQGFLRDILGDRNGVSLDRFLIVAWNLALGTIFIATVYTTLAMPDFSASLLGLMGISAGTYLGLKVPEREP
jgi:hypothetical protein